MNKVFKIILILLGLGALASFLDILGIADIIYRIAMMFNPGTIRDVILLISLGVILYGIKKFDESQKK